jgi:hypothetical protein
LPDYFANKPPIFADRLFTKFQKLNIFDWKEGTIHTVNPVVRHILLEDMRLNARDEFIDIQKTLVEMYDNLTRENKGDSQYFTEKLYHSALLLTLTEKQTANMTECLCEQMQSYLDTYFVLANLLTEANKQFLSKLGEKLGSDTELGELLNVDALLSVIDKFVGVIRDDEDEEEDEEVEEVQPIMPLVERVEITKFDNFLQAGSPIRILTIDTEGQGGVGKTIFLLQMQERCASRPDVVYTKELIDFFQLETRNKNWLNMKLF